MGLLLRGERGGDGMGKGWEEGGKEEEEKEEGGKGGDLLQGLRGGIDAPGMFDTKFRRYDASRQTDRHRDTRTHHNTSFP